jgi:hypothetical protein
MFINIYRFKIQQYFSDNQIKWWGNLKERDHLEDPGIDWRTILKWILRKCNGDMDWIDRTQDRGKWRALVNAVINLPVA